MNVNKLTHSVFWPETDGAAIMLVNADGKELAWFSLEKPMRGSEIARMVPQGMAVEMVDCVVVSMSGELVVGKAEPFDTTVITERAQIGFEERMARLERRDLQRERARQRERDENNRLRLELKQKLEQKEAGEDEPLVEDIESVGEPVGGTGQDAGVDAGGSVEGEADG